MKIETQEAETIYNVAGDVYLHNSPEVAALLKKEQQTKLKDLYSTSFFELLRKEYEDKTLIIRDADISAIKEKLIEQGQLILSGDPGIGKTTTTFQLLQDLPDVVYISVKDRAPISTISYLVNKIRLSNNEELTEIRDITEGIDWLQASLGKTKMYFIVDDCEQDKETVNKIISLKKLDCTFLFVTRNKSLFETSGISSYSCSPFTEDETKRFLNTTGISFDTISFNDLVNASKGNPLYLFYFSKFQISPLPDSLGNYQSSIWAGLSAKQTEALALMSIPYFDSTIVEITEVLKYDSPLSFANFLNDLSPLIKNNEGTLELFHPSFKEFVRQRLTESGLLRHYQELLGDFYLDKKEIIQATYLLIDISPEKVDKYLYNVFPVLIEWGELSFAVKVMRTKLQRVTKDLDRGYLNYHLCGVEHLLGNREESSLCIDKALNYLKKARSKRFYNAALMYKAMNLIEEGMVDEAKKIADEVLKKTKQFKEEFVATIFVNLSKIYVDLFHFEKGAEASKTAFEIFEKKRDKHGMKSSLVNLVTCLSQISTQRQEAEKYGLQLLEIAQRDNDVSVEIIVLNALTSIYREKREYEQAKIYSSKVIQLCQQLKMKDKVVLNLVNYGNVLRDAGEIAEAKRVYHEALISAKDLKIKKDEGRISWILSSMERQEGNLQLSLSFADKSIQINTEISSYFGIANAYRVKSKTLLLLGRNKEAADALVSSARNYMKIKEFNESYTSNLAKAIEIYYKAGEEVAANELINELLHNVYKDAPFEGIVNVIINNSSEEHINAHFETIFSNYFTNENGRLNLIREVLVFIDYCKKPGNLKGKKLFRQVLDIMLSNLGKSKFSYSILAISIEQSGFLVDGIELHAITKRLQNKLAFFSYRSIEPDRIIVTSICNKINLEIRTFDDELLCAKLAIALVLLINEAPELIITNKPFKESHCLLWLNTYSDEFNKAAGNFLPSIEKLYDEDMQTTHLGKTNYSIQELIIVSREYETWCDLTTYPNNKVSFYFFTTTVMSIKSHFYHSKVRKSKAQRKEVFSKTALLFDYTDIAAASEMKSKFEVNIDKLTEKGNVSD